MCGDRGRERGVEGEGEYIDLGVRERVCISTIFTTTLGTLLRARARVHQYLHMHIKTKILQKTYINKHLARGGIAAPFFVLKKICDPVFVKKNKHLARGGLAAPVLVDTEAHPDWEL